MFLLLVSIVASAVYIWLNPHFRNTIIDFIQKNFKKVSTFVQKEEKIIKNEIIKEENKIK